MPKLSEVDIKETLLDNEYVLGVSGDGEVVKTPKGTIGKVKTVNDVEPDENGNVRVDAGNPALADVGDRIVNEEYFSTEFTGTSIFDPEYANNPVVNMLIDLIGYEGTSVIVEFDGEKYECTSTTTYPHGIKIQDTEYYVYRCLGNARLGDPENMDLEDTQEPFLFAIVLPHMMSGEHHWAILASDDQSHTFRITQDVTKTNPIPEKYLPANALVRVIDCPEDFAYCPTLGGYTLDETIAFIKNGGVVKLKDTLTVNESQAVSSVFYEAVGFIRTHSEGVSPVENGIIFATNAPSSMYAYKDSDYYTITCSNSNPLPIITWVGTRMIKGDHMEDDGNDGEI